MAPWVLAILYDILYYVCRRVWHEIPVVGGRATGAVRPRAPSLRDRRRRVSFRDLLTGAAGEVDDEREGLKGQGSGQGQGPEPGHTHGNSTYTHQRDLSRESIQEEDEEEGEEGMG